MATKQEIKLDIYDDLNHTPGYNLSSPYQRITPLVDSIVDNLVDSIDFKENVISIFDPSSGLPSNPTLFDRYIASVTANGWTQNNIYEWTGALPWVSTVPGEGMLVWVETLDKFYVFNGNSWIDLISTSGYEPAIEPGENDQVWFGDKIFKDLTTSVVPEGSRLYYTDDRVKDYADGHYSGLNHDHDSIYALVDHTHDYSLVYAAYNHNHNGVYATVAHNHNGVYSLINHTHDYSSIYAAVNHTHTGVYASVSHNHDDRYSTISGVFGSLTDKFIPHFRNVGGVKSFENSILQTITNGIKLGTITTPTSTATPNRLQFDQTYSNGYTKDKGKIEIYNNGAGAIWSLGIGPDSDLQFHASTAGPGRFDYYVDNVKSMSINYKGINLGSQNDPAGDQGDNWITWGKRVDGSPHYAIRTTVNSYGGNAFNRLQIGWHTGIEIGAYKNYGGIRFFNNSPFTGTQYVSFFDGDDHVRIGDSLFIGQNTYFGYTVNGPSNVGYGLLTCKNTWGNGNNYPTLTSTGPVVITMVDNPHVGYRTDNRIAAAQVGYAGMRYAAAADGSAWWEAGVTNNGNAFYYHIAYFNGSTLTDKFDIANNGDVYVSGRLGVNCWPEGYLHIVGDFSGGSGDMTNITNPHLKIHSVNSYPRIVHTSGVAGVNVVYNYQAGKSVYWGEAGDGGTYYFRGRNLDVSGGWIIRGGYTVWDAGNLVGLQDTHKHQQLWSISHPESYFISNTWSNVLGNYRWRLSSNHGDNCSVAHADGSHALWAVSHPTAYYTRVDWDGSYWWMRGFSSSGDYHAPVRVGYADTAGAVGGFSIGTLSTNRVAKASGSTLVNSQITDNGTTIDLGGLQVSSSAAFTMDLSVTGNSPKINLKIGTKYLQVNGNRIEAGADFDMVGGTKSTLRSAKIDLGSFNSIYGSCTEVTVTDIISYTTWDFAIAAAGGSQFAFLADRVGSLIFVRNTLGGDVTLREVSSVGQSYLVGLSGHAMAMGVCVQVEATYCVWKWFITYVPADGGV